MNAKRTKTAPSSALVRRRQSPAPPVLIGRDTPQVRRSIDSFFGGIAEVFERWVTRRESPHTQRAYRQDVMAFVARDDAGKRAYRERDLAGNAGTLHHRRVQKVFEGMVVAREVIDRRIGIGRWIVPPVRAAIRSWSARSLTQSKSP